MLDASITRHRIRKLHKLLEQERAMLGTGSLANLPDVVKQREFVFEKLRGSDLTSGEWSRIRSAFAKNSRMLLAFEDGLVRAGNLLDGADKTPLYTYNAAGRRVNLGFDKT